MKIAILGWGSLIWNPEKLNYDKELGWNKEGPILPIEFSRISKDGRLTLVLDKNANSVKTLYAISNYSDLEIAILDLAIREGCSRGKIGSCEKIKDECRFTPNNFFFKNEIENWLTALPEIHAVIWTNLSVKFKDTLGLDYCSESVIKYLQTLSEEKKALAEEYIRKAPNQICTKMRKEIEDKLKWTKIS